MRTLPVSYLLMVAVFCLGCGGKNSSTPPAAASADQQPAAVTNGSVTRQEAKPRTPDEPTKPRDEEKQVATAKPQPADKAQSNQTANNPAESGNSERPASSSVTVAEAANTSGNRNDNTPPVSSSPKSFEAIGTTTRKEGAILPKQIAAYRLLVAARKQAELIVDPRENASESAPIAWALAMVGDIEGAKETAAQIKFDHDKAMAYCKIAKAQAEIGDTTEASRTLEMANAATTQISNEDDRAFTLRCIAEAQANVGDFAGAKVTAGQINDSALYKPPYLAIAEAQAQGGDIDGAKVTASQLDRNSDKAVVYLEIAQAQIKAGDVAGAGQMMEAARAVTPKIDTKDDTLSDGTKKYILEGYLKIAEAQRKVKDTTGTHRTLEKAKELAAKRVGIWQLDDGRACADVAEAQAKAGDFVDARATVDQILDEYNKDVALCKVADVQAKAGDIGGAKVTASVINTEHIKASAYSAIAVVQATAGDVTAAKATVEQISREPYKNEPYRKIAEIQATAGDVASTRQTLAMAEASAKMIGEEYDKAVAYRKIADVQVKVKDVAGARKSLATAKKSIANSDKKLNEVLIYCEIADIAATQAEADDVAAANATAEHIDQEAGKALAFSKIVVVQTKARDLVGARKSLEAAKTAISNVDDRWRKEWVAKQVLPELAKVGNGNEAVEFAFVAVKDASKRCGCLVNAAGELCPTQCAAIPKQTLAALAAENLPTDRLEQSTPEPKTGSTSLRSTRVGQASAPDAAAVAPSHAPTAPTSNLSETKPVDRSGLNDLLNDPVYGALNRQSYKLMEGQLAPDEIARRLRELDATARQAGGK